MTAAFMNLGQTDGFGVPGRENDRDGRTREIFLSDGNSAMLQAKDPYGLWYISWKNGKTPGDLIEQKFTSASAAEKFLRIWLEQNRYDTKPVEEKVEIPEPQYKRVKKEAA